MNSITIAAADDINREHRLARRSAESAVQHAVRCGQLLAEVKATLPHGQFGAWIAANCEFKYSTAARYLKAATQNSTAVEISSLRHLFPSGRAAATRPERPASWLPPADHVGVAPLPEGVMVVGESAAHSGHYDIARVWLRQRDSGSIDCLRRPIRLDLLPDPAALAPALGHDPAALAWAYHAAPPGTAHALIHGGALP